MANHHLWTREGTEEAVSAFKRTIELDPNFASAYGMAARCYPQRAGSGWVSDREHEMAEAERLARRAAELGRDDAVALCTAGFALLPVGNIEDAAALIERALALNPNLAWAWLFSGWVKVSLGQPEVAIEHIARAMRLSPHDPQIFNMHAATACAHFVAGRYAEALSWADMAVRERPNYLLATCVAAASGALTERSSETKRAMARVRQLDPGLQISNLKHLFPFHRSEDFAKWEDALRKAGLPE